jgi:hypothetical protein
MNSKNELEYAPPITRVHNIFRLRTIVNATTELNKKGKYPSDDEIGLILAKRGLSKIRHAKMKDRIMRRARDHLLTASYMGLLTRFGKPFGYQTTTAGRILNTYSFGEECPKDVREESVFIDRILRLKLTNVYDLQFRKQYTDRRSRPCLYILHILKKNKWLHEHQIGIALGCKKCDPILEDKKTQSLINIISQYKEHENNLNEFYKDFGVEENDIKNITRNIRPLLDWCESIGLISSKEIPGIIGKWYNLTDRGRNILEIYNKKIPIWYIDLRSTATIKAALLLFYQYALISGFEIKGLYDVTYQIGLITKQIGELAKEIEREIGIDILDIDSKSTHQVDFNLDYDVMPEDKREVIYYLSKICKSANIKFLNVMDYINKSQIDELIEILEREHQTLRYEFIGKFAERTAISSDPVLTQVSALIPSAGILNQYKSDFEKETAILLRLIRLNAVKYQGQFADRCSKRHITSFFENNPDILIINGIESLVECKSSSEWKSPLKTNKNIPKELLIYENYLPEVKSDSILLIYEGSVEGDSQKFIKSLLKDSPKIVFINKNYLINCIYKLNLRKQLLRKIKKPNNFPSEERLLLA